MEKHRFVEKWSKWCQDSFVLLARTVLLQTFCRNVQRTLPCHWSISRSVRMLEYEFKQNENNLETIFFRQIACVQQAAAAMGTRYYLSMTEWKTNQVWPADQSEIAKLCCSIRTARGMWVAWQGPAFQCVWRRRLWQECFEVLTFAALQWWRVNNYSHTSVGRMQV